MEWGTPVQWGKFLLFCVPQSVKTKETNPTRPGSPTPCKQALRSNDADGNENVKKKTIGLISKTTTLHHAFLYISLPVFARLRREHA